MTVMPNSVEARDIAYQMHPAVNLRKYERDGGLVIETGDGIYVTDNNGKRYIEGLAGLWSVALGFGEKSGWPRWPRRRWRNCPTTTCSTTRRTALQSIWPSC